MIIILVISILINIFALMNKNTEKEINNTYECTKDVETDSNIFTETNTISISYDDLGILLNTKNIKALICILKI